MMVSQLSYRDMILQQNLRKILILDKSLIFKSTVFGHKWHDVALISTVDSQQEDPGFESTRGLCGDTHTLSGQLSFCLFNAYFSEVCFKFEQLPYF